MENSLQLRHTSWRDLRTIKKADFWVNGSGNWTQCLKYHIAARGVNSESTCPLCRNGIESISHLLRECPFAVDFWRKIGVPASLVSSFNTNWLEWLKINSLCNHQIQSHGYPWRNLFPFAVWGLWKHRNKLVFENTALNHSLHKSCINQAAEYFFCVGKSVRPQQQGCMQISWNKPNVGWHKLNTDGASMGNPGKTRWRGNSGSQRELGSGFCSVH